MRKATIRIRKDAKAVTREMGRRFVKAWKSGKSDGDVFEFESPSALFKVLTPKRWELVERLQATGPSSFRALARELERDVKRVHADVAALIEYGLVARNEAGQVHVPYDLIRADFDLKAAA